MAGRAVSGDTGAFLVGRERELAVLREHLDAVLAGRGALVLIGGEAGIGKTALAEVVLAEAERRGALVLVGRCYDLSETPPYGPWRELFARAPGDDALPALPLADLPPEGAAEAFSSRDAIMRRWQAHVAALAARQPVVLLLDDLHWADPASLDLLRFVARGLGELPVLALATYRADEVARDHPLSAILPVLVRESRADRLDLRPLDAAAIEALVAARYSLGEADRGRLVRYLAARTEGNALFLGELLRALEGERVLRREGDRWQVGDLDLTPVPTLLRQIIEGRAGKLGPEARRLLLIAAVIGQDVPLATWAAVAELAEDRLLDTIEQAVEARLLVETADGVRFAHALVREALYEGMLGARRRVLHRRTAELLASGPGPDPDAVANHFARAGDSRASDWLVAAGERAQRAYAWLTAAERFEGALALLDGREAEPRRRALLRITLAQLRRYDDPQWGIAALEEAARLATEAEDGVLTACARFDQGHMRCSVLDFRRGIAQMAAELPTLEALPVAARWQLPALVIQGPSAGDQYHRGVLMVNLARGGRYDEAWRLGQGIATEGPGATARGLFGLGLVHAGLGRPDEARRAMAAARAIYRATENHAEAAITLAYEQTMAVAPYQADQLGERRRLAVESAEAWARGRGAGVVSGVGWTALPLLIADGRWTEARELAFQWGGHTGNTLAAWALGYLGWVQGDAELALRSIGRWLPDGPTSEPGEAEWPMVLYLQRLAAVVALGAGDLPLAQAWLAAHERWLAQSGAAIDRADGQLAWAMYYRASGDFASAWLHAERAQTLALEPRQPLALLGAHRLLGELATASARYGDAQGHLDAALAEAEACAAPYERALTLLALAELRAADDRPGEAGTFAGEARGVFADLGAAPALARADALAARFADQQPAASAEAHAFGLTTREVEVLALLARGLTDVQIAEQLFVSRHTIGSHTRAIYGKLGVNTRAAAARLAIEHHLA